MKPHTQSKTLWANLVLFVAAALTWLLGDGIQPLADLIGTTAADLTPILIAIQSLLNIGLRLITTQPLGKPS